ncbi:hypothetical protein P7K49_032318 [Saguinus oedipus]|uniref:Uncharacterized protein n=1 Tax=Saguinus oedipus TaxID=9490 RepID=A0ABQ9TXX4_SAGOE|nr:hypothetical protein P7K49_032318 [Saguinus oedipus]
MKSEEIPRLQTHSSAVEERPGLATTEEENSAVQCDSREVWIQAESWLLCRDLACWPTQKDDRLRQDLEVSSFIAQAPPGMKIASDEPVYLDTVIHLFPS